MLMVLLGDEAARKICEQLPPEASLRTLAQEIAALGSIPPEAAAEVLQEYQQLDAPRRNRWRGAARISPRSSW